MAVSAGTSSVQTTINTSYRLHYYSFFLLVEKSIFQDRMTGIRRRYQTRWGAIEFLSLKLLAFGQDMNAFFLLEDDIIYEF